MRLASPPRGLTLGTVRPELGPAAPCELSSPCGAHVPVPLADVWPCGPAPHVAHVVSSAAQASWGRGAWRRRGPRVASGSRVRHSEPPPDLADTWGAQVLRADRRGGLSPAHFSTVEIS